LLIASFSASAANSPSRVVEDFYVWAMQTTRSEAGGKSASLASVRSLIGKELYSALETQSDYELACAKLIPDDIKGHMLDQSPFFDSPDGVHSLHSTKTTVIGDVARVYALFSLPDRQWTDTVILRRRGNQWQIVNIEWPSGRSLTRLLVEFAGSRCGPKGSIRPNGS